jgi:hypothetical protein
MDSKDTAMMITAIATAAKPYLAVSFAATLLRDIYDSRS